VKGRKYFGRAGHLIVSDRCRFHIHTHVNGVCVSTVGEYYPGAYDKKPSEIGLNRLYETFVFRLDRSGEGVKSYSEIDSDTYNDVESADLGHEAMCAKYEKRRKA